MGNYSMEPVSALQIARLCADSVYESFVFPAEGPTRGISPSCGEDGLQDTHGATIVPSVGLLRFGAQGEEEEGSGGHVGGASFP